MPIWLRAALFLVVMPGSLALWIPWLLVGRRFVPAGDIGAIQWLGLAMLVVGWAILLWCARDFARRGHGTPAPYDPPVSLVTNGLYRFTRNPMYVGVVTAIFGQAFWHRSTALALYASFVALAFHLRVLMYEEPRLIQSFGAPYADYLKRVPRWFLRSTFRQNNGRP